MRRMNRAYGRWQRLGVACGLWMCATAGAADSPSHCDRYCLRHALDRYFEAVFQHQPLKAGLTAQARATTNAELLRDGDGIWNTASAYGSIQRRFFDPASSQAAYFGEVKEGETTDIVSLRIKVDGRKISEAEWTIARKSDGNMFSLDGLAETPPPPDAALPLPDRTPRSAMINAGGKYFDGLEAHDGSNVPHVPGCERVENGFKVTHRRRGPAPQAAAALPAAGATPSTAQEELSGDCTAGFEMFAHTITAASHRRFPVVDEEAGVVMGTTLFQRPPGATMKRNLLTEYFFIKGGKISAIYAAMYYLDPGAADSSGWN
jgi:hypothetical protein